MRYRIKQLLKKQGITQEQLAERLGTHPVTISRLLGGSLRMNDEWLDRIAHELGVTPFELIDADSKVPVVGYVGAGAQVWPVDDHVQGAGLEEIEVPWPLGEHAVAVIVRGDSMRPAMREGDILIYDNRLEGDLTPLIGSECILALADGRMFVKELAPGSAPGRYTLLSHNAPPMLDQSPQWAAKINLIWRK